MTCSQCQHSSELCRMSILLCRRTSHLACTTCYFSASIKIHRSGPMPGRCCGILGYSTTGKPYAAHGHVHKVGVFVSEIIAMVHEHLELCLHLCNLKMPATLHTHVWKPLPSVHACNVLLLPGADHSLWQLSNVTAAGNVMLSSCCTACTVG